MNKKPQFGALRFGALPVDRINKTLGLELEDGEVVMSSKAHAHAARSHPSEYADCLPHIASVLANPLYLRDDFKNHHSIELVSRVPGLNTGLLVAVSVSKDEHGTYNVHSFYPISQRKIDNRRRLGSLINAIK